MTTTTKKEINPMLRKLHLEAAELCLKLNITSAELKQEIYDNYSIESKNLPFDKWEEVLEALRFKTKNDNDLQEILERSPAILLYKDYKNIRSFVVKFIQQEKKVTEEQANAIIHHFQRIPRCHGSVAELLVPMFLDYTVKSYFNSIERPEDVKKNKAQEWNEVSLTWG